MHRDALHCIRSTSSLAPTAACQLSDQRRRATYLEATSLLSDRHDFSYQRKLCFHDNSSLPLLPASYQIKGGLAYLVATFPPLLFRGHFSSQTDMIFVAKGNFAYLPFSLKTWHVAAEQYTSRSTLVHENTSNECCTWLYYSVLCTVPCTSQPSLSDPSRALNPVKNISLP